MNSWLIVAVRALRHGRAIAAAVGLVIGAILGALEAPPVVDVFRVLVGQ